MKRLLVVLAVLMLGACGSGDDGPAVAPAGEDRTVEVEMRDIAFAPTAFDVKAGEKVRFVFKNAGQVTHDAFIGDQAAQDAHEREMRDGHGGHGTSSNAVSVAPGKTAQLVYTFDRPGQIVLGCHQPGHYTGGMKAAINVA
ncbi:MAG TPA: plastocyanin/azurin family copper-binding protein [Acidimicrobiales bacterium]|nr:plastocyanin/azurin family copper-binding protein [Acidimicrobiales bacterium]